MIRVAIGVLLAHGFPAPVEFWDSLFELVLHVASGQANVALPDDLKIAGVRRIKSTSFPVDFARNDIMRAWLAGDEDYLLFLDADHAFGVDLLERLLRHRVSVVTARYHMRKAPFHACAYVKHRTVTGPHCYAPVHYGRGLIEIERGGAGALLIRRDAAEAIRFHAGENWFRYQRGPEPPHDYTVSEDFWFYQMARESGHRTYCDWDTEVVHLTQAGLTRYENEAYLDRHISLIPSMSPEERQRTLDALIVCGYPDGLTLPTGDVIPNYTVTPGER